MYLRLNMGLNHHARLDYYIAFIYNGLLLAVVMTTLAIHQLHVF